MYIPRWILLSLVGAAATIGGWMLHGVASDAFGGTTISSTTDAPAHAPGASNIAVDGGNSSPVINLVVGGDDGADGNSSQGTDGSAGSDQVRYELAAAGSSRRRPQQSATAGTTRLAAGGASIVVVDGRRVVSDTERDDNDSSWVNHETYVSNDSRITVNGNEIVVASDGSIVFQGDNGSLNGNTGDSSSSGTIAIDNNGSTISTGTSGGSGSTSLSSTAGSVTSNGNVTSSGNTSSAVTTTSVPPEDEEEEEEEPPAELAASSRLAPAAANRQRQTMSAQPASSRAVTPSKPKTNATTTARTDEPFVSSLVSRKLASVGISAEHSAETDNADAFEMMAEIQAGEVTSPSPLWGWSLGEASGRAVSISGYEDHSITVDGNDQIILYDDSNVFINRNGQVNANTGDTDSSGLNVVDAVDSIVRSGNSGDGEGSGDEEEEEEEDEDEGVPAGLRANGAARAVPRLVGRQTASLRLAQAAAVPAGARASGSVDDEDTTTSASGDDVLIIGGDGYDDLAVRSRGNGNIVVYDDSNLVLGGTGGVNAQIGDSDTAGAVVMGVRNSIIEAGCEGDLCPLYRRP